jgi:predicted translin family RNA/ssDNA-binding protein
VLSNEQYVRHSLEFNLFFLRIAKEHAIFAAASLPPRDRAVAQQLLVVKNAYEALLADAVSLAPNVVSPEVLAANEIITELTLPAEEATEFLTGLPINTDITKQELNLITKSKMRSDGNLVEDVSALNKEALALTEKTIAFLTQMLNNVLSCKAFSYTYPSMLHHVTEESKFAAAMLRRLENRASVDSTRELIEQELFWNHIMEEHSEFIRGYLDPSEKALFKKANNFADEFEDLYEKTKNLEKNPSALPAITRESINLVTQLRNFKHQGTVGILECKIKSIIPPLLSDHVLREANHYLRLLKSIGNA